MFPAMIYLTGSTNDCVMIYRNRYRRSLSPEMSRHISIFKDDSVVDRINRQEQIALA